MSMFRRRTGSGSFPNVNVPEPDENDVQACGHEVVKKLRQRPRKNSLTKPKRLLKRDDKGVSNRKQKKNRKRMYYEELDLFDSSPVDSEEDDLDFAGINILDYDDPDLEAPVFWAATDKVIEDELPKATRKQTKKSHYEEIPYFANSPLSRDWLPTVEETDEDEGCPSVEAPTIDELSKSPRPTVVKVESSDDGHEGSNNQDQLVESLRDLVLEQQETLVKLAVKSKDYRKRLAECQARVLTLKKEHLDQKDQIHNLELDKEALEAQTMWMREELVAIRSGLSEFQLDRNDQEKELQKEKDDSMRVDRAILVELKKLRTEICAIVGRDIEEDSYNKRDMLDNTESTTAEIEGRSGVEAEILRLRALVGKLHLGNKKSNKAEAEVMPDWLDFKNVNNEVEQTKQRSHCGSVKVESENEDNGPFFEPDIMQEDDHEPVPEWLDVPNGDRSIAELTTSTLAALSKDESYQNEEKLSHIGVVQQGYETMEEVKPGAEDVGNTNYIKFDTFSSAEESTILISQSDTSHSLGKEWDVSSCVFPPDEKHAARGDTAITSDIFSEPFLTEIEAESRLPKEEITQGDCDLRSTSFDGNISLEEYFQREASQQRSLSTQTMGETRGNTTP